MRRTALLPAFAIALLPLRARAQTEPLPALPPSEPAHSSANAPAPASPTPGMMAVAGESAIAPSAPVDPKAAPPIDCTGPGTFTHDGFYFRFSSGLGAFAVGGSGPLGNARTSGLGSSGALSFGGTPGRGFVVGGSLSAWTLTSGTQSGIGAETTSVQASNFAAFVDWFPSEHRGWHAGGLLGIGLVGIKSIGRSDWLGAGLGGGAFGGYDFWIGPQWSLGIQGALAFTTRAQMKDADQNDTGYTLGALGAGVEATLLYH